MPNHCFSVLHHSTIFFSVSACLSALFLQKRFRLRRWTFGINALVFSSAPLVVRPMVKNNATFLPDKSVFYRYVFRAADGRNAQTGVPTKMRSYFRLDSFVGAISVSFPPEHLCLPHVAKSAVSFFWSMTSSTSLIQVPQRWFRRRILCFQFLYNKLLGSSLASPLSG